MEDKNKIYIAALLNDIGKFIERAKLETWKEKAEVYYSEKRASRNYAHRRFSAAFVKEFVDQKDFLDESIESLVLWHHRGNENDKEDYEPIEKKGVLLKLLRIADNLASSERREDSTLVPVKYNEAKILSPFNDIKVKLNDEVFQKEVNAYLDLVKLDIERDGKFPNNESITDSENYKELVNGFIEDFNSAGNEDSLLALLEKYTFQVPAQNPVEINGKEVLLKPDINLYDHSRAIAAIAYSLYLEYHNGTWKGKDKEILNLKSDLSNAEDLGSSPCILICGNVNGIQDFIFNITSEKAAKKLKGRSYFIQLLTEGISNMIIKELDLKAANILYNGGGNFYILAPACVNDNLDELKPVISEKIMDLGLYLSIGSAEVELSDFNNFGNVFRQATEAANQEKYRKFRNVAFEKVFKPFSQIVKDSQQYETLTEKLNKSKAYSLSTEKNISIDNWQKLLSEFNFNIELNEKVKDNSTVFNETEIFNDSKDFKFAVKDLPTWSEEEFSNFQKEVEDNDLNAEFSESHESAGTIIPFERLAQFSELETGTNKLGILKMDVDNLGLIISEGIPEENRTIGRIAYLSRSLKWFFEGYINSILNEGNYKNKIYVIFSGGDDFFAVGAWNKIFDFAKRINKEFGEYVYGHPGITLSASILVLDHHYPVARFAPLAEDRLHQAKYESDNKNSINVFDTILGWEDFKKAEELKNIIVKLIKDYGIKKSLIQKINNSSVGFEKIQKEALKGNIKLKKVWRFSYYLRDIIIKNPKTKNDEEINHIINEMVEQYENYIFDAFNKGKTNIRIFPVAARWAELETRNVNKVKENNNE